MHRAAQLHRLRPGRKVPQRPGAWNRPLWVVCSHTSPIAAMSQQKHVGVPKPQSNCLQPASLGLGEVCSPRLTVLVPRVPGPGVGTGRGQNPTAAASRLTPPIPPLGEGRVGWGGGGAAITLMPRHRALSTSTSAHVDVDHGTRPGGSPVKPGGANREEGEGPPFIA